MSVRQIQATKVARRFITDLAGVRQGERVLILADQTAMQINEEIVYAVAGHAQDAGAEATIAVMPDRTFGNERLSDAAESALEGVDVLVALTVTTAAPIRSVKTDELKKSKRLRVVHGVYRRWEDYLRPYIAEADFASLRDINRGVIEAVNGARTLHLTSDLGTDFVANIDGMTAAAVDTAFEPGQHSNIAWGEVYFAPNEGQSEGVIVIDGPILLRGQSNEPITLNILENRVRKVEGSGPIAEELRRLVAAVENADNIGEIAIGTHPFAENIGTTEPKKLMGSVHFALGDGILYGQRVAAPIHVDCVLLHPTVALDDRVVVRDNKILL